MIDHGVSHFQINFDTMRTYQRFNDEVLPLLRL